LHVLIVAKEAPAAAPTPQCDYSDGEWVPDPTPPLYNATTCEAIKDGRSCTANGRADTGYLHWRWKPRRCDLPAFSPDAFLRWLHNKHLAFVGDSLARNQAESLVCLLSSRSPPELARRDADSRFRRWVFREHGDASVSVFWSPFLVRGIEKAERAGVRHNSVFLDAFDERWMAELAGVDALVLSAGHWFKIPSVYHEGGRVVGCHGCAAAGLNRTAETGFFAAFRDAVHRTLAEVPRRWHANATDANKLVAMATFSPSHFEGDWDKGALCPKKRPYKSGETELGYTEVEMRRIVVEEVEAAANASGAVRFAALDVTTLANLRPDGHPGPYMHKNPVGRVQNDCLHWCMPGPVDTFNQILLHTVLR
jgi:xyloglucan O-acetyltransferase